MPETQVPGSDPARQPKLDSVRNVIAVSSCKGGVGKSTVAVNLALALAREGYRTGLADVDVYGPSVPMMLAIDDRPKPGSGDLIAPVTACGIEVMSMGFFLDDSAPVVWRGPMAMSATRQFLRGVEWSELDYLVVDLPPGTGDIVLTLAQEIPLDGAVIVTTPQDVALADVRRGIAMFARVNTPVLGVVENMSAFVCPDCATRDEVFGARSGEQLAMELGLPLLAELPLDERICSSGDVGKPIVLAEPEHAVSVELQTLARRVAEAVASGQSAGPAEPVEMEHDQASDSLRIRWSDGETTEYLLSGLRGWCPCAECQGHSGSRNFVAGGDARLTRVEGVGRYAVRFYWGDGHSTGMYPYAYLRELAEFPECKPA